MVKRRLRLVANDAPIGPDRLRADMLASLVAMQKPILTLRAQGRNRDADELATWLTGWHRKCAEVLGR